MHSFTRKIFPYSIFLWAFLSTFFISNQTYALGTPTISSIMGTGNWNDPLSWSLGRIPNTSDIVSIEGNITAPYGVQVKWLRVTPGSKLTLNSNLVVTDDDLENYGTLQSAGALYLYKNVSSPTPRSEERRVGKEC